MKKAIKKLIEFDGKLGKIDNIAGIFATMLFALMLGIAYIKQVPVILYPNSREWGYALIALVVAWCVLKIVKLIMKKYQHKEV